MAINKTDMDIMTQMLSDNIITTLRQKIIGMASNIVKQFVFSNPKPNPKQKAVINFCVEIEVATLYTILDKIDEYKNGKRLNRMSRKEKIYRPEDYS